MCQEEAVKEGSEPMSDIQPDVVIKEEPDSTSDVQPDVAVKEEPKPSKPKPLILQLPVKHKVRSTYIGPNLWLLIAQPGDEVIIIRLFGRGNGRIHSIQSADR